MMADKVVSGIGRELRYFEYKLRKRQKSKKNKKDRSNSLSGDHVYSDTTHSDDFRNAATSEEFRKAMPGSRGEEELQIQVALAMSHEEEKAHSKELESDKLRLEMALKESMKVAENKKQQNTAQPSLLDLSLGARKPAPASVSTDFFSSPPTNEPWGASAAPAMTFDPFSPQQPSAGAQVSAPYGMGESNFAAPGNAWGGTSQISAPVSAPVHLQDPWGASTSQPQLQQVNAFPVPQANDPWGTSAPVQNAFPSTENGPWGNVGGPASLQNAFPTTKNDPFGTQVAPQRMTFDPFSEDSSSAANLPQGGGFGVLNTSQTAQSQMNNPFSFGESSSFTAPPFDPLHDFDSLHIGTVNRGSGVEPMMSQSKSGTSVAQDTSSFNQVLLPTIASTAHTSGGPIPTPTTRNTNVFLGENSDLVNLDSGWKTYQVPYAKPLGTVAQNPFQQTGPVQTLNEIKNTSKQPGF